MIQNDFINPETPLVSIALCTYNGEKFIKSQLDSILKQTYSNLEIIICDDGSTDQTLSILNRITDPRVKIFRNSTNIGLVDNFFKAISLSTGKYIALSDQDDYWLPIKIEELILNIGDNLLIYCDSAFTHENGDLMDRNLSENRRMYSGDDNRVFAIPKLGFLFGHTLLFKSELKTKILPYPAIYHDFWIGFVASSEGSIIYLNEALVHYRQHDSSATNSQRLILHPNHKKNKKEEELREWISFLNKYQGGKNKNFFTDFLRYLNNGQKYWGKTQLILFYFVHSKILFYTKSKFLSRINIVRKLIN
jgi:glycosyltransferase involved in cell wall biosynthesis